MAGQGWKVSFRAGDSFKDRQRAHGGASGVLRSAVATAAPALPPGAASAPQSPAPRPAPAAEEEIRRCSRGDWCYGRTVATVDGKAVITAAITPRPYCERCAAHIGECLDALPKAYLRLHRELGEAPRRGQAVHAPFGPRLPLREDIDALMRLMAVTLCGWEARVRAVPGLGLRPRNPELPVHTAESVNQSAGKLAAHLEVLLALQPGWMVRAVNLAPGRHGKPAAICDEAGQLIARLEPIADTDMMRLGVDFIATLVPLSGGDAGREILQLHYKAASTLGETRKQAETLDGVPCRNPECEDMALELAEPPSDPSLPAMYSRCASCHATMSREDFTAWAAMYAAWADDLALVCRRCKAGRCGQCLYGRCACAKHAVAA